MQIRLILLAIPLSLSSAFQVKAATDADRPQGIAGGYTRDVGIESDSRVVFAENFENTAITELGQRWETVRDPEIMQLSNDVPSASRGRHSMLFSQRAELGTGADLYRRLDQGYEKIHARYYVKFAEDCEEVHHFGTCVGGNNPSTAWPTVKAGFPTQGDRSFWVGIEPFGAAWRWDYYTYWHEMRGSPPRGQTWGNSFIQRDDLKVDRGQWICIEQMIRMNDVGKSNGEMALWIDGQQVSHLGAGFPKGKWMYDKFYPGEGGRSLRWNSQSESADATVIDVGGQPFEGFQFRTSSELNVNFVWLYLYLTKGTEGHENRVWFDDVVVATEYIGPINGK